MYPDKSRVCLLDPSATKELSPEDGETFDVFLFGGILGMRHPTTHSPQIKRSEEDLNIDYG